VSRYYTPRRRDYLDTLLDWIRSEEPPMSRVRIEEMVRRRRLTMPSGVAMTPEDLTAALATLERRGDVTSKPGSER